MRAIMVQTFGGPEVLKVCERPVPAPGKGEARVRIEAIGVNFIDVYHRTGVYPGKLPFVPGMEAAGVVDEVGDSVTDVRIGDRVAYAMQQCSYAECAVVPAWKLVPLPPALSFDQGAAAMLQGMTAHYLACSTFALGRGHLAVVHAAAGGVGLLLTQVAKMRGAKVIGLVSTQAKAELARQAGADEVVVTADDDWLPRVRDITRGALADVVYDSVGKDTVENSIQCLKPRGMLVLYGQSSGLVPPFDLKLLAAGSLFVTRPGLHHYSANREELLQRSGEVFAWIERGELELRIEHRWRMEEASEAHRALEGRKTTGKQLLIP